MKTDLEKRTGTCQECGTSWVVSHLPVHKTCPECFSLKKDAQLWWYLTKVLTELKDDNLKARNIYNYVLRERTYREAAQTLGSKGGKIRAKNLSPKRKKEIATKASHSRKSVLPL